MEAVSLVGVPALGFNALIGLELLEHEPELLRARVAVRDEVLQPAGVVHGGLYTTIAESLASMGTGAAVAPEGKIAMGLANQTSFLRPITGGFVHGVARARHRGRTTWVWDVELCDDEGRLCAVSRMTVAVRDDPGGGRPLSPGTGW